MIAGSVATGGGGGPLSRARPAAITSSRPADLDRGEQHVGPARLAQPPDVEGGAGDQQRQRRPDRRHVDEDAQVAAEGDGDGRRGGGAPDQDHDADAERQPVGLGPGAADVDVFGARLGIGGRHLGVGNGGEKRDARADDEAQPQALLRQAGGGADHRIDAGADDDADAVEHQLDGPRTGLSGMRDLSVGIGSVRRNAMSINMLMPFAALDSCHGTAAAADDRNLPACDVAPSRPVASARPAWLEGLVREPAAADPGVPAALRAGGDGLFRLWRARPDRRHARPVDQGKPVADARRSSPASASG